MMNRSLGNQATKQRGEASFVEFVFRDADHGVVERVAICLCWNLLLAIRGEKGQRGRNGCSFVSVQKSLCLCNPENVSAAVVKGIHRLPGSALDCTSIAQARASAVLDQRTAMQFENGFEREKADLTHSPALLRQPSEKIAVMSEDVVCRGAEFWICRFQFTNPRGFAVAAQFRNKTFNLLQLVRRKLPDLFLDFRDRHTATLAYSIQTSNV